MIPPQSSRKEGCRWQYPRVASQVFGNPHTAGLRPKSHISRIKVDSTPPVHFWKYALVCQPNYMVDAPCICMAEPEAFQDELIGRIRTPYEIHVDLHMAGAGWVRGPLGRQRARPASILNMPPRAPPAGVCAAGGARRSRTSLEGPGGVPIYFIWPMSSSWNASGSAIQIHGAPTM